MSKPTSSTHFAAAGVRLDVASTIMLALLRVYKLVFSPLYPGACRFMPSCSDYAATAIRDHGAVKGAWLAVKRLSRCHPYGGSGVDAVPPRNA